MHASRAGRRTTAPLGPSRATIPSARRVFIRHGAESWKKYGLHKLLGDPKADAARLRITSPVDNVARIRAPVLLAYGGKDRRVPLEHGDRFHDALMKQPGAKVEWVVYKAEGHGWRALDTNIDF